MQIVPYFNSLQTGVKGLSSLNLDFLIKKLSCFNDDVFVLDGEEYDVPPLAAKFCPGHGHENILGLASEDGEVLLLDTNQLAKNSLVKRWKAHSNAIFDICWANEGFQIITASGDHQAVLWDVVTKEKIATFQGHSSSIKNVASQPKSQNVFATASRDGSIMIWDTRNKCQANSSYDASIAIHDAHNAESMLPGTPKQRKKKQMYSVSANPLNSVTSIIYQDEFLLCSAGTGDGVIKIWDLRKYYSNRKKEAVPYIKFTYQGKSPKAHGFTSLSFNKSRSVLYASCTDSVIYAYNCSSYVPVPVASYYGHKTSTFFVKMTVGGNGKYLLSGSSDNKAYIWKVSEPGPPFVQLMGHQAEVTAVAWNLSDFTKLVTCSDDVQVFFWNIKEQYLSNIEKSISGQSEEISNSFSPSPSMKIVNNNESVHYLSPCLSPSFPQIFKLSHSVNSGGVSPEITRWFKPNNDAIGNKTELTNKTTKIVRRNDKTFSSTSRKRKQPKIGTENYQKTILKAVISPDESRVLSPKKPANDANLENSQSVRRSLDMDTCCGKSYSKFSLFNKRDDSKLTVRRPEENKLLKTDTEKSKNPKLVHTTVKTSKRSLKVLACENSGLITNYFSTSEIKK